MGDGLSADYLLSNTAEIWNNLSRNVKSALTKKSLKKKTLLSLLLILFIIIFNIIIIVIFFQIEIE